MIATVGVQLESSHPVNLVPFQWFSLTFEKTYLQIERKEFALMFTSFFAFAFCFRFDKFAVLFLCFSHQEIKSANDIVHSMEESIGCVNVMDSQARKPLPT
jgi:hypothetical protein